MPDVKQDTVEGFGYPSTKPILSKQPEEKKTFWQIPEQIKTIVFDVDGTLAALNSEHLYDEVAAWLKQFGQRYNLAVATNQGGVHMFYYHLSKGNYRKAANYPDESVVARRMHILRKKMAEATFDRNFPNYRGVDFSPKGVLWQLPMYWCFVYENEKGWKPEIPEGKDKNDPRWDPAYRKPNSGMIDVAMDYYRSAPEETLYVGDLETDQLAAQNAACSFIFTEEFFNL